MKQTNKIDSPNVLLITIDALRRDHLGCYGYHRNTSPNIDALAAKGVTFLQAISNGGQTTQAFPSILESVFPPLDGSGIKPTTRRSITLAEVFKNAGYQTAAFHSNPLLSHFYGYSKGFNVFDDSYQQMKRWRARRQIRVIASSLRKLIPKLIEKTGSVMGPTLIRVLNRPTINANEINNKATSWLQTHSEEFLLWLHYMDVHFPYMPAGEYLSQFCNHSVSRRQMINLRHKMIRRPNELSQTEIETLINLYDADIKYTDEMIGSLLDRLRSHLDNTIVIITADHGEEFGEHGSFGHQTVYDGTLRVPLIIAGPDIKGGTVVKQQIGLIDLAPTIVDLAALRSPRGFQGKSLLPRMEDKEQATTGVISVISTRVNPMVEIAVNIAYRIPDWKYILSESLDDGRLLGEEVYDLGSDPGETKNLHGEGNGEADRFELEARKRIAQFKQLKVEESTDYEKQKIKAKLSKMKRK